MTNTNKYLKFKILKIVFNNLIVINTINIK